MIYYNNIIIIYGERMMKNEQIKVYMGRKGFAAPMM